MAFNNYYLWIEIDKYAVNETDPMAIFNLDIKMASV